MEENQNRSEKLQELSLIVTDKIRSVGMIWWYGAAATLVLTIPIFFIARGVFVSMMVSAHKFPAYIYQEENKVPLEVIDKKIFKLSDNSYAGYLKIKNSPNLNWGVAVQPYTAVFSTTGGTEVTRITSSTFISPASEKIVVFKRFTADKEPTTLNIAIGDTQFVHKPEISDPNLAVERVQLQNINSQFMVSAAIKNNTPFTVKRIGLPVLLYDKDNKVVGANYTNIDEVGYGETRSFQFTWTQNPNAVRAEILPEVNIFETDAYKLPPGSSQFDSDLAPSH